MGELEWGGGVLQIIREKELKGREWKPVRRKEVARVSEGEGGRELKSREKREERRGSKGRGRC